MSERFYINCPLGRGAVALAGAEARHLATVCRLRPGDAVTLFNGDGHEYPARVMEVSKKHVNVEVMSVESPERELGFPLIVAAPMPKGDRGQFLIEKLTELGVTQFVPLSTARSVVHPRESKLAKLERYVIEASKQCGRNVLMKIEPLVEWDVFCKRPGLPSTKIVAHPSSLPRGRGPEWGDATAGAALAVGPEGGFTEPEVAAALAAGWQAIDLGPRILRIETAAIFLVCSIPR